MATDFKLWRVKADLTQEELHAKTGIFAARISLIERGLVPSKNEFEKLRAGGVPVDQFWPELVEKYAA